MTKLIVTIDGPAAAGKGTIAYLLARRYHLDHLDSGAFYRGAAWLTDHHRVMIDDQHEPAIVKLLQEFPITIATMANNEGPKVSVHCAQEDITDQIRSERISRLASEIGGMPQVRQAITVMQRAAADHSRNGVVAEGRDTGIVVFPDATVKFFLTAAAEVRAQRRHAELVEQGTTISFEQVLSHLQERDRRDTERDYSALRVAEGAIVIDATLLTIEEVLTRLSEHIDQRLS